MTGTVIIMSGIPGSGKTTLASAQYRGFERISLDDIRRLDGSIHRRLAESYKPDGLPVPPSNNRKAEHMLIDAALRAGRNVVIDDTNLTTTIRMPHIRHAARYRYAVHAVSFSNFGRAMLQNRTRKGRERVPDGIMASMRRRFEAPRIEEGFESVRTIF